MIPDRHFDSEEGLRRYEALLAMADVMVRHATLAELFRELADRLHAVVSFDLANFSLHDSQKNVMRIHGEGNVRIPHVTREQRPE